jgi:hypothetical protein
MNTQERKCCRRPLRPFCSTLRRRSLERIFTNVIASHSERSECAPPNHLPDRLRHEPELLPTELDPFYPTDCDQTAVRELWQEVHESRNSTEYKIAMASSTSSSAVLPAQPILLTLEDYCKRNNIVMKLGERGRIKTSAAGHFSNLGPLPTRTSSQLQFHGIDADVVKSMQMKLQEYKMNRDSVWEHIQQLFFPPSILSNDPFLTLANTSLDVGDMFLETSIDQQTHQPAEPRVARGARPASTTYSRSARDPPSKTQSGSKSSVVMQSTSSRNSTVPTSYPPIPIQTHQPMQPKDVLLSRLFPHTTFWLKIPYSVKSVGMIRGVLGVNLMFPYLTIVRVLADEQELAVHQRAVLIASCILSSHFQELKLKGQPHSLPDCLRHYVIILDTAGWVYSVFEVTCKTGSEPKYVMKPLEEGDIFQNFQGLESWLKEIHTWAAGVWRPQMMKAFKSEDYLDYEDADVDSEMRGGAEDEARNVEKAWAAHPSR